ncbi:trypsin-like serine protease [Amycolatopsis rubida]|uniref:Trypsin n=1 Tax=Amycolatopsis rubida TaxID=112413 RepID=A0A1I5SJP6_9PSEU|nr:MULTISPECIES: trypsin-like serine protease [Amycolatopsis]MYW97381.1 trypsin-like serine protease [Amycolatopsis rubida]NEC62366.1 trypsin-like serine protease [Amycolatopsis rubida]OAP22787.1 Trypsin-like protease precursor [Amycolatopsis sp. M39]SFP70949.1 Trypsin [Amycolatopsis rubida]
MVQRAELRFLSVAGVAFAIGAALCGGTAQAATGSGPVTTHALPAEGAAAHPGAQPNVVGGHKVTEDVPFIAALHGKADQKFHCTASLIAAQWVLTAKHCVDGSDLSFRIGSLHRSSGGQTADSTEFQEAPGDNDVALVKLDKEVQVAQYAKVGDVGEAKVGLSEHVFGWGYENPDWTNLPEDLKTSSGSIEEVGCGAGFGDAFCIKNDGETSGGDSGGPAIDEATGNVIGVCSFGHKPTAGDGFGGYQTVVSKEVRDWITATAGV